MLPYFIVLLVYLLSDYIVLLFSSSLTLALLVKLILVSGLLVFFRKDFKFRIRLDFLAVIIGLVIFLIWVAIDRFYPHLDIVTNSIQYSAVDIVLKFLISVVIASIVEEFFTRFFLIRWLIDHHWQKVELGKYTLFSFIITVLFFGLSHSRWLAGLIVGVLFNLLYYKRKNIESCVLAHSVANLALGIYVVYTGNFGFW
jgi:CAAX prenyl protease-like protein